MKASNKGVEDALDGFQAVELKEALAVVRRLIVLLEVELDKGSVLTSVPVSELLANTLRLSSLRTAVEVFRKVHENKFGLPIASALLSQPLPPPQIRNQDGVQVLTGVFWIPLINLDSELSKREGVAPLTITSIRYDRVQGIYLQDAPDNPCPLSKQQYECLRFIHTHPNASMKAIAQALKLTKQNASNVSHRIKEINDAFVTTIGRGRKIILRAPSGGYALDLVRFSISGG